MTTSAVLVADYGQIELHLGVGGSTDLGDVGLAVRYSEDPVVTLIVARQYGPVQVTVEVHPTRPPAPEADAVVEFSGRTGMDPHVSGWAGAGELAVPVQSGTDLRVRYIPTDGQDAVDALDDDTDAPGPDTYRVQVWPEAPARACVVRSTAPWTQYWTFGAHAIATAATALTAPPGDRLMFVVDAALTAHPDIASAITRGEMRYRLGVHRYVQELDRLTTPAPATDPADLDRLIDDRARHLYGS